MIRSVSTLINYTRFLLSRITVLFFPIFIMLIAYSFSIASEVPQEVFNRGNFYLEQEDYIGALEKYRAIEKENYSSGPLFLNMAVSYVHVDSLGLAKYYFLKAGKFAATKDRADEGVTFIDSRLNQERGTLSRLSWISFSEWMHFELNKLGIIIVGLLLFNMGFLFIAVSWFSSAFQRTYKYSGTATAILGVLFILSAVIITSSAEEYSRAVMVETRTNMRTHPTDENEVVSIIYEGYTLTLDQSRSKEFKGWKYARLSNGLNGWIEESVIREL